MIALLDKHRRCEINSLGHDPRHKWNKPISTKGAKSITLGIAQGIKQPIQKSTNGAKENILNYASINSI
jgi:hypothetical protein